MTKLDEFAKVEAEAIYQSYVSNAFLDKICEIMDKKGISNTQLAKLMGVSKSAISRLLSDNRNLTIKKLASIFHALDEKVEIMTASELSSFKVEQKVYVINDMPAPQIPPNYKRYLFNEKMSEVCKDKWIRTAYE